MLVDDLGAITSRKLDRKVIEPLDPTLQPNSGYKKYGHFNPVIPEMFEEHVLNQRGPLYCHVRIPLQAPPAGCAFVVPIHCRVSAPYAGRVSMQRALTPYTPQTARRT